jgi:cell division protein ZapA
LTKTIEIEIYGQRYSIKGDADEEYVKRVAAHVDEQIRALAQGMKTATLSKLAVLAALNLAHQLFQSEHMRRQEEGDIERRALCLMESIEEQLQPSRSR